MVLAHVLAVGLDLLFTIKQATKKPSQAGKPLTDILLKFLAAIGLGVSFRKSTVSAHVLRVPAHRYLNPHFFKRCLLKSNLTAEALYLNGAC